LRSQPLHELGRRNIEGPKSHLHSRWHGIPSRDSEAHLALTRITERDMRSDLCVSSAVLARTCLLWLQHAVPLQLKASGVTGDLAPVVTVTCLQRTAQLSTVLCFPVLAHAEFATTAAQSRQLPGQEQQETGAQPTSPLLLALTVAATAAWLRYALAKGSCLLLQ
jgi:hypothetical protein